MFVQRVISKDNEDYFVNYQGTSFAEVVSTSLSVQNVEEHSNEV